MTFDPMSPRVGPMTRAILRTTDIMLSGAALLVFSPFFLVISLILRLTGEGEVFFRQTRIGMGGRPFGLLKFATMRKDSPSLGTGELTIPEDPRVLPVGRVLRKTKINELPQLWNVFVGDMSIIGPRPQTAKYYDRFDPADRAVIAQVRPGLSGVGSILFRDEEDLLAKVADPFDFDLNVITPYKGRVENWVGCNMSIALYWRLIFLTVAVIVNPQTGHRQWLLDRVPPPPAELANLL